MPMSSVRGTGLALGVPKSTVQYQSQRSQGRVLSQGTDYWESPVGQTFLKKLIVGAIYTFSIKGGLGAGRISEYFSTLGLTGVAGVSESSIQRLTKEVEASILLYKELQERGLKAEASAEMRELKLVLGLDETWLDEMLLVCQDLTSGYLFLKSREPGAIPPVGGRV